MTKEEFDSLVEEQKRKGLSEEDIVKAFAIMFRDGTLDRKQFEACLNALGYELQGELKDMSDEELKEAVLEEGDKQPPEADGGESKDEESEPDEEEEEESEETETEEKADGDEDEEEKKSVMKDYFGFKD